MSRLYRSFDLSGGHPALDFVNTLDERPFPAPAETLADYAALVRFAEVTKLLSSSQASQLRKRAAHHTDIAKRARELREQVYGVLSAWRQRRPAPRRELRVIASAIREAQAARALCVSNDKTVARYEWLSPHAPELPLYACALAIEDLLTKADRGRIRKCGAADCEVYFIDTSKGHRRHWCSMENCGNREKQRRWRAERV